MIDDLSQIGSTHLTILANFCRVALVILNARLLTLLALVIDAGAFGWVMWQPDYIRLVAACSFAVLVFWPCSRLEAVRVARAVAVQPPAEES